MADMENNRHNDCPDCLSRDSIAKRMLQRGEDPRQFADLYEEIRSQWRPSGATEWLFFHHIFANRWILARFESFETRILARIGRLVSAHAADTAWIAALDPQLVELRRNLREIQNVCARRKQAIARDERDFQRLRLERNRQPAQSARGVRIADWKPLTPTIQ